MNEASDQPELVPARMLNEYAYCPRLGYLEWVQVEFAENAYVEDGRRRHRRVDEGKGDLPPPEECEGAPVVARSVMLSAVDAGLVAKIDLVEADGSRACPVDYKRGKKPDVPEGAYEPERVQLCAQGIILRENGFECDRGMIYFAGSRERVEVRFDDELVARTLELASGFRELAASGPIPPPLEDSPKCYGCSLSGICLPDEIGMLGRPENERAHPRRLTPSRDDALPLYVQDQGAYVSKKGDQLEVKGHDREVKSRARLFETSCLCLMGRVQVSTQAVQELCKRGIPIVYLSTGGWYYGMTRSGMHKNIELRLDQYRVASDRESSLGLARRFVANKIRNCRTLLRRNAGDLDGEVLRSLKEHAGQAELASSMEMLLGIEGNAARIYFGGFASMLKQGALGQGFSFDGRNRRPPLDPVNAMLSLAYSMLVKDLVIVLSAVGFDPYLGFYHRPRYGRPSLALDLMEEFRPLVADSTVISAVNNQVVGQDDFVRAAGGVSLKPGARKAFIKAYERRMDQLITHPVFGYRISYRRVLEVQARLLGRYLSGEIPEYPEFKTR